MLQTRAMKNFRKKNHFVECHKQDISYEDCIKSQKGILNEKEKEKS